MADFPMEDPDSSNLLAGTFSEDNAAGDMDFDCSLPSFSLQFSPALQLERRNPSTLYSSRPASLDFESIAGPSREETPRQCLSLSNYFLDDTSSSFYSYERDQIAECSYLSTPALCTAPRRAKHRRNLTYPSPKLWPQNSVGSSTHLSSCTQSQSNNSLDEPGSSALDYSKAPRTPDSEVFESEVTLPNPIPDDDLLTMMLTTPVSAVQSPSSLLRSSSKPYDYLLKFLLVGDSDVGKHEILENLEDEASGDTPFISGPAHKTTTLLLDGRRVRLQVWDTSGQGRFCTVLRSYSRGAQGVLLVFDLTNRWSFDGLDRWLKEIEHHAPGVPKVLVGNRLHLEFRRSVPIEEAEQYAKRNGMSYFEISPLCNYNVMESFGELARRALRRNGMERLWRAHQVPSLQELCCRSIVSCTSVYGIDKLPLPGSIRTHLRSYAVATAHSRVKLKSSKSFRKKRSLLGSFNQNCTGKKKICALM